MSRIMASRIIASLDRVDLSRSTVSRRHRLSHANVRSTTHRLGSLTHPFFPSGRLTTAISYPAFCATQAYRPWLWYLLSAHSNFSRGNSAPVTFASTTGAAVPSSSLAEVTATATSRPIVSTTTCLFRPLTFLWLSRPRADPPSVAGTDWVSMLPALGVGSRPSATRTRSRSASWIASRVPLCRHSLKYRQVVLLGGKSVGKNRHGQPVRST
jgi:hypothetical protein